jgi:hypothetical protein
LYYAEAVLRKIQDTLTEIGFSWFLGQEMTMTRLLRIALIALVFAGGASSCCSLKRYLNSHEIGPEDTHHQSTAERVTLILRDVITSDFCQWKVASDEMCTQSSGKIGRDDGSFEQTWLVGSPEQHIWFWWDTLNGEADATVLVNDVVVFEGHCIHSGHDKVTMIQTCSAPRVYKTFSSGPYLRERPDRNETDISFAVSKMGSRFGGLEN